MSDLSTTLDSRYTANSGPRLPERYASPWCACRCCSACAIDAAGLNTAGFVSGYRGSPLGGLDQALWKAKPHISTPTASSFSPAVNEDLAATAVWGDAAAQSLSRCANTMASSPCGTARVPVSTAAATCSGTPTPPGTAAGYGGVLVIAGDDHAAKSSTLPHQTEHIFKAVMMPVLYPANVQEYLDYGLHGWAMSRYSGCWVVMKALADTVETSASVID
jgi:indolepyruvate ferredoxin oxidoreductase